MTVAIYYIGSPNLGVLLTQLQPQLHPTDDIYIIDTTPEHSALNIARIYGSTRCVIFVEIGKYTRKEAIEFGIQSAKDNKQNFSFLLDDSCIISNTFVANLKRAFKKGEPIYPLFLATPYLQIPSDFKWYYPSIKEETVVLLPYKAREIKP